MEWESKVMFQGEKCTPVFSKYANNDRLSIRLISEYGIPVANATINLIDEKLDNNQIAIKDGHENSGMLIALILAQIIELPTKNLNDVYHICTITDTLKEYLSKCSTVLIVNY